MAKFCKTTTIYQDLKHNRTAQVIVYDDGAELYLEKKDDNGVVTDTVYLTQEQTHDLFEMLQEAFNHEKPAIIINQPQPQFVMNIAEPPARPPIFNPHPPGVDMDL